MGTGSFFCGMITTDRIRMRCNQIMKNTLWDEADGKKYQEQGSDKFFYGRFFLQQLIINIRAKVKEQRSYDQPKFAFIIKAVTNTIL